MHDDDEDENDDEDDDEDDNNHHQQHQHQCGVYTELVKSFIRTLKDMLFYKNIFYFL